MNIRPAFAGIPIVVDYSLSMRPKVGDVATAIDAFARAAGRDDELFVLPFNDSAVLPEAGAAVFTNDAARLRATMDGTLPAGRTALYDGIVEGLRRLQHGRWEKKALIVISDGGDNASRQTIDKAFTIARGTNAAIYSIGLLDGDSERRDRRILERLSDDSGAEAAFPRTSAEMAATVTRLGRSVRRQYTLSFVPDAAGRRGVAHSIQVKVSAPGLRASRSGRAERIYHHDLTER